MKTQLDLFASMMARDRRDFVSAGLLLSSIVLGGTSAFAIAQDEAIAQVALPAREAGSATSPTSTTATEPALDEVVVTAARLGLIGTATTSSQGVILNDELALTPAFRPGQLLETVPGLVVTSHSGEGKANQYLLRGFNLDHGTDLATFVDGMPINQVTHAHGQGYTDLNFMVAELATDIQFTKGPYFADEGDFASVGSVHINYLNTIPAQLTPSAGTLGFQRLFAADSTAMGESNLLAALELQHYDGPWVNPDDQRKINAALRYSGGDGQQGYSLTGMFYHGLWNATTDQPIRAVANGLIARFGSLDPSDGGQAQRWSFSGQYHKVQGEGEFAANGYIIGNQLTLWNNFTHYLIDQINGDQEAQHEDRSVTGGGMTYRRRAHWLSFDGEWIAGLQLRNDLIDASRAPTKDRQPLPPSADPLGFAENDHVHESSAGAYAQLTTHWTYWLRSVLGLREDYFHERDHGTNPGRVGQALLQPKGSLIFTPIDTTELYVSAGRGFHSDDARGVNKATLLGEPGAPLIAKSTGEEFGVRQQFGQRIAATLTIFNVDFQSETTYDPDAGVDSAGPPSRRNGAELNVTYQVLRWLEFYATLATSHARFTKNYDDGTGHSGTYIPNAPNVIASFAAYVKNRGPWSGGLDYRYLGSEPLTPDNAVKGRGYGEWNGDVRYSAAGGWNLGLGLYNILNQHANAAEFWYIDRLPGNVAQGVADLHTHPLEPLTIRLTIGKTF